MANLCYIRLSVSGEHAALAEFVERAFCPPPAFYGVKDAVRFLSFNATVPVPPEVVAMGYDAHEKHPEVLAKDYTGVLDEYHWCFLHWGTPYDVFIHNITPTAMGWKPGCTKLETGLRVAWHPPTPWMIEVASQFPSLQFDLHYEVYGFWYGGDLSIKGTVRSEARYDLDAPE